MSTTGAAPAAPTPTHAAPPATNPTGAEHALRGGGRGRGRGRVRSFEGARGGYRGERFHGRGRGGARYRKSERVHRHVRDVDRIQDSTPRAMREIIADPIQVDEGEDITLGAMLLEDVKFDFSLPVDDKRSVEKVLTAMWQEAEADALVFLARNNISLV